ncbi:helix-hairpin-helix domain-containing protein [Maribacter confluentis]|uniref:Helix-hairpin-helix domain-containing protein n=1 Tax=Maribacter confluentis TaxID=1656093 RepID=A0ABT8RNE1_9FLAO|nr:helix-hairpin-helix domain-containing protein [Maribacter confluentis]MDO1511859.1 helix-hairpin-helix domain-containing protein [Maribacter confluentis]
MKKLKSHFKFTKQERSGIFFLLLFLVLVQIFFYVNHNYIRDGFPLKSNFTEQQRIDSLKQVLAEKKDKIIYKFNPNFISDYKGYSLGMSVEEIDRLHEFRNTGKFVNSAEEFQKVTLISDSLLKAISPNFNFPEWVAKSKIGAVESKQFGSEHKNYSKSIPILDINEVTAEQLQTINGIGEKLSTRIIKFRDRLGGFLVDEQLFDVYGLEDEVVEKTLKRFKVLSKPKVEKINVNTATVEELSKLIYIQKVVAQRIVNYRNLNGSINSLNELLKIEGFPSERIERIGLYLSL